MALTSVRGDQLVATAVVSLGDRATPRFCYCLILLLILVVTFYYYSRLSIFFPSFLGELDSRYQSFTGKFTCNHLGLFARLITSCSISSMVVLQHACVFFRLFLESRNYKIQTVARVGRKSAVVPSGVTEASCSHFFIGRVLLS